MLFSSITFLWLFLPICLVIYYCIPHRFRNVFLLVMSILFYAFGGIKYLLLLLLSVLVNYIFGRLIERSSGTKARVVLWIGILINLSFFFVFKYSAFFVNDVLGLFFDIRIAPLVLPLGISFYTFQALSYLIDLYHKKIECQHNIIKLALYIMFFPQLIAGPIVKYRDVEKQLDSREDNLENVALGIKRFIYGLAKKVIVANTLASVADRVFDSNISNVPMLYAWIGVFAYSMQLYYDFSGYSDMAIGIGKMFGFTFAENFNYPYMVSSVSEYWKKWHISMTSWFREYLYFPLGGSRKGIRRTYINIMIVFIITGIWHGAGWTYILWGLMNGVVMVIEKATHFPDKKKYFFSPILTFICILLFLVMFRANSIGDALLYYRALFGNKTGLYWGSNTYHIFTVKNLVISVVSILGCGLYRKVYDKFKKHSNILEMAYCMCLLAISIVLLVSNTYNPFIYFRF